MRQFRDKLETKVCDINTIFLPFFTLRLPWTLWSQHIFNLIDDSRETFVRVSHDSLETFMRANCETLARVSRQSWYIRVSILRQSWDIHASVSQGRANFNFYFFIAKPSASHRICREPIANPSQTHCKEVSAICTMRQIWDINQTISRLNCKK